MVKCVNCGKEFRWWKYHGALDAMCCSYECELADDHFRELERQKSLEEGLKRGIKRRNQR